MSIERTSLSDRWTILTVGLSLLLLGCRDEASSPTIVLATTTSTRDSGLLDVLIPLFEGQSGIATKVIAVGSGQALELGRRGDADVLLTHAPDAEAAFVRAGHAALRWPVMVNDFVLVGPPADPAGIAKAASAAEAMRTIAAAEQPFVSRGDDSGTHMKETVLWQAAGIESRGGWYVESGIGMAQTFRIANEKSAYTLSDRGTFLAHHDQLDLAVVHENDPLLHNPYSVMVVAAEKHEAEKHEAALQFAEFLTSAEAQQAIADFGIEKFGQPLFLPQVHSE